MRGRHAHAFTEQRLEKLFSRIIIEIVANLRVCVCAVCVYMLTISLRAQGSALVQRLPLEEHVMFRAFVLWQDTVGARAKQ